jgi:hypothetical protein
MTKAPINPAVEAHYQRFESLGVVEVKKQLATNLYGEERTRHAKTWLELKHQESQSTRDAAIMTAAREANDLARSANDFASSANEIARDAANSARESARAAKTSNTIATVAVIMAVIAMAISIIGIFLKR